MSYLNKFISTFCITIIALFSVASYAENSLPTIVLNGNEQGISVSANSAYLIDKDSTLTAQSVANSDKFIAADADINSWLEKTSGSVWSKLVVRNGTDKNLTVYIEYPFNQPSTVVLYQRLSGSNSAFNLVKNDLRDTSNQREISTPRVALPLNLEPNESKELLIETYSDIATVRFTDFRIWSTANLVHASNVEHIIFGIVFCFIIVSSFISLVLFRVLKEKFFLWYSLFALSSFPVLGLVTGILNLYIPNLDYHPLGTISMVVMMAAGIQFIRAYSNASYHSLLADKILHLTLLLALIALPVAIIGFHELAMDIQQLAIFTFPVAIITAIYCGVKGEKQMSTMILAKSLFFVTLLVLNLQSWGYVKPTYGLVYLPTVGMLAQLICLLWAMYNKAKIHFSEGSAEDIDSITDAYEQAYALQEQVKRQNQMLKAAKEQAEFEARTDMLTHLPNRRAFMNLAKMAIAQANRQQKPLTFIAFDIDNFKLINDQYGHPAGDQTLVEVAELTRTMIRASDFCGRIGGEEFMIGCHNNSLGDAYNLAERIRKAIEECVIDFDGHSFSTTVSLGLAQVTEDDDLESVIKKADEAMYESKANGKNKVTHFAA
ncbi:diguanylate cyclase [Thalassotalea crassostreae]|uniref:sensor domain-containing diguanylate cyclase n=1 Tax=Thalassotalea crassostreae TaxID=1763536 RepID=UPI0008393270|nr:diguanylate cyclase [Thalassotalea crassostreae]